MLAKRIGIEFNSPKEAVDKLIEKIKDLNKKLNIPKSFIEYGISENEFLSKIDSLADKAFEDQCTNTNPRLPLIEELKTIMVDAFYGNI